MEHIYFSFYEVYPKKTIYEYDENYKEKETKNILHEKLIGSNESNASNTPNTSTIQNQSVVSNYKFFNCCNCWSYFCGY